MHRIRKPLNLVDNGPAVNVAGSDYAKTVSNITDLDVSRDGSGLDVSAEC